VTVRYRVDGGAVQLATGRETRTDHDRQAQYFAVDFPTFPTGKLVEYSPMLANGGLQVPAPAVASGFPSKFLLAAKPPVPALRPASLAAPASPRQARFGAGLSFVAVVHVQFDASSPAYVCDTAAGMRVDFFVKEGTVAGDGFKARVTGGSSDHLIVRPDGMGLVRIRASFVTADGATLDIESGGYVDFGPDGYRRALARNLPDRSPMAVTPLIHTRHPKYRGLSRLQCIGVGYTQLDAGQVCYHVYSVAPETQT